MQDPHQKHWDAAIRVLRYLAGTTSWCLQFGGRRGGAVASSKKGRADSLILDVSAYADADWAGTGKPDRRSTTGWVVMLNGDPVSWAAKKQSVTAQSTCEAELYAEAAAINEVLWQRGLLSELGFTVRDGSKVYGDNESTLTISRNGVKGERTKHVDVKYHFVTECIDNGLVDVQWVPTDRQQADVFTKALDRVKFEQHRGTLMASAMAESDEDALVDRDSGTEHKC